MSFDQPRSRVDELGAGAQPGDVIERHLVALLEVVVEDLLVDAGELLVVDPQHELLVQLEAPGVEVHRTEGDSLAIHHHRFGVEEALVVEVHVRSGLQQRPPERLAALKAIFLSGQPVIMKCTSMPESAVLTSVSCMLSVGT